MALEIKMHDLEKFVDTFSSGNAVENFLEERSIPISDELSQELSKDDNFMVFNNGDKYEVIIAGDAKYLDSHDNPFSDEDGLMKIKRFRNSDDRDSYLEDNSNGLNKKFFLLDRYCHGAEHYSISGTVNYPDQRWDVAHGCAVVELSDDAISVCRALIKKHGKEDGTNKVEKYVNLQLDSYSNYVNGAGYEIRTVDIDKDGNFNVEYGSVFLQQKDMETELKDIVISRIGKERILELTNSITLETASDADLKGFSKNIMRKDALSQEIFKFEDSSGIESKMALISFPDKLVIYANPGIDVGNGSEEKATYSTVGSRLDSYKEYAKRMFVNSLFIAEFNENINSNTVLRDQSVELNTASSTSKMKM